GTIVNIGVTRDVNDLWAWLTGHTGAVGAWLNQAVTARFAVDPFAERWTALRTTGRLIDGVEHLPHAGDLNKPGCDAPSHLTAARSVRRPLSSTVASTSLLPGLR